MDTLLYNGDHYLDSRRLPVTLSGKEELIQQILIRLSVRKGAFSLEPRLGSELYKLRLTNSPNNSRLAFGYVQEALAEMPGVEVRGVTCTPQGSDFLNITVTVAALGELFSLEVPVSA